MLIIHPLYKYKTAKELIDVADFLVVHYTETGEDTAKYHEVDWAKPVSMIYILSFILKGLQGIIADRDQRITELNTKIKEMGIELSQLKRQKK